MFNNRQNAEEKTRLLPKKESLIAAEVAKNSKEELKEINRELNQIIYEERRSKSTVKYAFPGVAANVTTFFALNYFVPGLGAVNGVLSSAAGGITHTVTQKVAGNDTGPALKTGSRTAFAVLLSEGIRSVGSLVGCPIAKTVISPLVQGIFHSTNLKDTTEVDKLQRIKALVKRQRELTLVDELPKECVINIKL